MHRFVPALFISLAAYSQTPPPDVDKALRDRVTEFFQYHVDGQFRKAFELVAEETKDIYFGAQKARYKSFQIDSVKYNQDFTMAEVVTTCEQDWVFRAASHLVKTPVTTSWKIENGKWVWYWDPQTTARLPMGSSAVKPGAGNLPSTEKPKDFSDKTLKQMTEKILQRVTVDKTEVELASDRPSSATVVVTNDMPGAVTLRLEAEEAAGFSATLDKTQLGPGQKATLTLGLEPRRKLPKQRLTVNLIVEPFNQVFPISINLTSPGSK